MMLIKRLQYTFFYLFICLIACSSKGVHSNQTIQLETPCDCSLAFTELVQKLEANYIALALLKDTNAYKAYEIRKKEFALKAADQAHYSCTSVLADFVSFFEDGHLFVWDIPTYEEAFLEEQKLLLLQKKKTRMEIDKLLADKSDPIVGKWSDGESVFAFVKEDTSFNAYLIKTNRTDAALGHQKINLTKKDDEYIGTYIAYNFGKRYVRVVHHKKGDYLKLIMGGAIRWQRSEEEEIRSFNKNPFIEKINEIHTLITIPSFSIDGKEFNKFLKANSKIIKNSKHLIIDIRGNTGGNGIYFPLIKYFANKRFTSEQGYVLASPDNIAYFKKFIGFGYSKVYSPLLDRMQNTGQIVDGPKYKDRDFDNRKNKIERVSIITDKSCKSAAESFVLHAKGSSDKVITFGSPTGGVIDYTSVNILLLKNSGRQSIYFGYPTGTLHKDVLENGYNKTGIMPDVSIPQTEEDIVKAVMDHFEEE
ncbi:MAG: S41 family peptidase [Bacteroidota bacterium]